jgi:hypothetical protein
LWKEEDERWGCGAAHIKYEPDIIGIRDEDIKKEAVAVLMIRRIRDGVSIADLRGKN